MAPNLAADTLVGMTTPPGPDADNTGAAPPGWYGPTVDAPYERQTSWGATSSTWASRLRRSGTDKMLAGVCGGIAERTDIDPVFIRLAFLICLFWGGTGIAVGILLYLAAALILPRPLP